jgi:large subunit ribosomal protein L10
MPSQKNINQVKELKENFEKSKSVFLSDYSGLSVAQINDLRHQIREAGGDFKVAKNSLIKLAVGKEDAELDQALSGPTAALFSYEDEIGALKVLWEYAEENEKPELKAGFLADEFLNKARAVKLAEIPGMEQLQAQLVGTLASPMSGLVNTLNGNLKKLVMTLSQIKDQKGGE